MRLTLWDLPYETYPSKELRVHGIHDIEFQLFDMLRRQVREDDRNDDAVDVRYGRPRLVYLERVNDQGLLVKGLMVIELEVKNSWSRVDGQRLMVKALMVKS